MTRDVTALADWKTSDPGVVTVAGGRVTAVATGTASVTATYLGATQSTGVSVWRPTALTGTITVRYVTFPGYFSGIRQLEAFIDTTPAGATAQFAPEIEVLAIPVGADTAAPIVVAPGVHEISVRMSLYGSNPAAVITDDAYLDVIDADTGESLRRVQLPSRNGAVRTGDAFRWTIQVERIR